MLRTKIVNNSVSDNKLIIKIMAIAIKSIPTLKGNDARSFIRAANEAESKRATIDYSRQAKTARSILGKAKML